jgi:hypothetical protein
MCDKGHLLSEGLAQLGYFLDRLKQSSGALEIHVLPFAQKF